jgi:hypothetical protein
MKGIYITEEGKKEIEAKIARLEETRDKTNFRATTIRESYFSQIMTLKDMLSSATVLPVEETWGSVPIGTNECELLLPKGVIIEPKIKKTL